MKRALLHIACILRRPWSLQAVHFHYCGILREIL
jgi:hypothetical protein